MSTLSTAATHDPLRFHHIAVLGAGAWGRALAQTAATAGRHVVLWDRDPARAARLDSQTHATASGSTSARDVGHDDRAGPRLPAGVRVTSDLALTQDADALLLVTPAQTVEDVFSQWLSARQSYRQAHARRALPAVVICAKGLCRRSGRLLSAVIEQAAHAEAARADVGADATPSHIAVLSGPSFAADVVAGAPTAVTLACEDLASGEALARALSHPSFRCYWSDDLIGVQVGGAIKNVLAIAAGIVAGAGLGASAHAALIARGFAEMRRIGSALGAAPETLTGLSGLGDLVLTCSDKQSRNMSLGLEIGAAGTAAAVIGTGADGDKARPQRPLSEGVATARAVTRLAETHDLELPICCAVDAVLGGKVTVHDAITALLDRPLKAENA